MQERDLVDRCEIVLVYLKPGVFGELHKIRPPTATITSSHAMETPKAPLASPVIPQNAVPCMNKQDAEKDPTITPVITGGTVGAVGVSTLNAATATRNNHVDTALSASALTQFHEPQAKQPGLDPTVPPPTAIPDINIFMTQRCSIPLIRCDYESALKAANAHQREMELPKVSDTPSSLPALPEQSEENTPVCMSGRTHTVINYKQFLEEYADAPPSPPKRRREVDMKLKRRPSKQCIAAERYQSKFTTKLTTVPKPVCNKRSRNKTDTTSESPLASSTKQADSELNVPEEAPTNKTLLTPATSAETRDAIDALLLLGELPPTNQLPVDDNSILVPILGHNDPETSGKKSGATLPLAPENVAMDEAPIKDNQYPEMPADNDKAPAIPTTGDCTGYSN